MHHDVLSRNYTTTAVCCSALQCVLVRNTNREDTTTQRLLSGRHFSWNSRKTCDQNTFSHVTTTASLTQSKKDLQTQGLLSRNYPTTFLTQLHSDLSHELQETLTNRTRLLSPNYQRLLSRNQIKTCDQKDFSHAITHRLVSRNYTRTSLMIFKKHLRSERLLSHNYTTTSRTQTNERLFPHNVIERIPPPRGGFLFTMFPHQEPCVRGPPSKNPVQILRGGSSYTRFLMREHSK